MIIEICLCIIAACFLILTISALIIGRNAQRTLRQAEYTLFEIQDNLSILSDESMNVLSNADRLLSDFNHKAEALNILFRPLSALQGQAYFPSDKLKNIIAQCVEVLDLVLNGVAVFKQLKR